MRWYPRGCPVCGGDLHDDLDLPETWVMCALCARSFPRLSLARPIPFEPRRSSTVARSLISTGAPHSRF